MADSEGHAARCAKCKTPLETGTSIEVVVRSSGERRETVLCVDCAVITCTNCGTEHSLDRLHEHRESVWERHDLYECDRCEAAVPAREIVELRHETNPDYRKHLCQSCLQEVPIPSNIRVIRDVS